MPVPQATSAGALLPVRRALVTPQMSDAHIVGVSPLIKPVTQWPVANAATHMNIAARS